MNTPDTEKWVKEFDEEYAGCTFSQKVVGILAEAIYEGEHNEFGSDASHLTKKMIQIHEQELTSRDTYWKERVRKEVEKIKMHKDKYQESSYSTYASYCGDMNVHNHALDTLLANLK